MSRVAALLRVFHRVQQQFARGDDRFIRSHQVLRRAVIYGSVMGSFCCEKFGPDRFRTLDHSEIDDRYREFKAFTNF